jgi:hypothetical protein
VNHSGDANKMVSDTPRTDAAYFKDRATMYDLAGEMKRMERELNEAKSNIELMIIADSERVRIELELEEAKERIKRLEAAGDKMEKWLDRNTPITVRYDWTKAKEVKP